MEEVEMEEVTLGKEKAGGPTLGKEATTPTLGKEAPTTTATLGKETGGMMVGGMVGAQVAAAAMMMTSGQSCHL